MEMALSHLCDRQTRADPKVHRKANGKSCTDCNGIFIKLRSDKYFRNLLDKGCYYLNVKVMILSAQWKWKIVEENEILMCLHWFSEMWHAALELLQHKTSSSFVIIFIWAFGKRKYSLWDSFETCLLNVLDHLPLLQVVLTTGTDTWTCIWSDSFFLPKMLGF